MKTKRFDFNYHPLRLTVSIAPFSGVPGSQTYNADADEYAPDYRLTPLTIQPRVGVLDRDGILPAGSVNASLFNIVWTQIIGGERTTIDSSVSGYAITTSGENAGRIIVSRNASPGSPLTLEMSAEYIDPRNKQIYTVKKSFMIMCRSATSAVRLLLDTADQTIYNPLSDAQVQTITAQLMVGKQEVTDDNKVIFVWELYRESAGEWSEVGSDEFDGWLAVSVDTRKIAIMRDMMGDGIKLRCRAKYSAEGKAAAVTLKDSSPSKTVVLLRKVPQFDYEIAGCPQSLPAGTTSFNPYVTLFTGKSVLENFEGVLLPLWYIATNTKSTLEYTAVAHGVSPTIPTDALDGEKGAVLAVDVVDVGPLGYWLDNGDGYLLTDSDGAILLI
jgi:hypothetical protein